MVADRLLLVGLLLAWSLAAWGEDSPWVKLMITSPHEARLSADLALAGYGGFAWGQLSPTDLAGMRQRGLMVSTVADPFTLDLGGEQFDPLGSERAGGPWTDYQADPNGDFYLVQFSGPVRPEWLQSVRESGGKLAQPLHPFSQLVWATRTKINEIGQRAELRWLGPMLPAWKVQPHLRQLGPALVDTMLLTSAQADAGQIHGALSGLGRVISSTPQGANFNVVHMAVSGERYLDLAALPFVYTVQAIPPNAGPRGEMSNQSVVGGLDPAGTIFSGYADWLSTIGFDGSGIVVSVIDGPVLASHLDLAGRMQPCLGEHASCADLPASDHGTHVAGALAGTGASGILLHGFLRGQGMAPGARMVSQVYSPFLDDFGEGGLAPDGMLKIFEDAARSGASLANNSWGSSDTPQGYDIPTRQVDLISRDADPDRPGQHPILAVWSIMNGHGEGEGACAPSSLGAPDEAKNLLAVASSWLADGSGAQGTDIYSLSANSAHGPACDGRQVIQLVAPGCSTDSTIADSESAHAFNYCGTSYASPIVTGAIAIWTEKFIVQTGTAPSPALARAVFAGAARDLVGSNNANGDAMDHRPNRFQGFGRLDLQAVMAATALYVHDQQTVLTASGQERRFSLSAADPLAPMHIMLAWTDAPGHGLGGSTPAWVNNLDLLVQANGVNYRGNDIGVDGWSLPGGQPDPRNNLEAVYLSADQHLGAVRIIVSAAEIAGDALEPWQPAIPRQDFALACFNCRAELFQDRFEAATGDLQ